MSRMSPLFSNADIFSVSEYQKDGFEKAFQEVSNAELDSNTAGVLARLVEQFGINVPVLDTENKHALPPRETQIDVSGDPMQRFICDDYGSGPRYVAGTEITFVIPFSGDAALFDVKPSTFTTTKPFGEVHKGELHLIQATTDTQFNVEAEMERNLAEIQQYLDYMRSSEKQLRGELEQLGTSLIERRKRERSAHSQIVASLKTPIRQDPPRAVAVAAPTPVYPPARHRASKKKQHDEWDVFISHATEDKHEIARPLADALNNRGVRVWYDDFALTLGDSLRQSIDRGLAKSLFGVVILSHHFFDKHWPQQELNGLANREVEGEKVILPVWHNINAEGVRHSSPTLADRKAVSTSEGLEVVVQKIMQVVRPD
jgi:hypothetical protein